MHLIIRGMIAEDKRFFNTFYRTLVSYARKFDNLKKQLIEANGGKVDKDVVVKRENPEPAKPTISMVFYPDSSVPKYDLEKVEKLKDIPVELKDLLKTRQLAKEKQVSMSLLNLFSSSPIR